MKLILAAVLALVAYANAVEMQGVYNCPNKCEKVFAMTQYAISDQPNMTTFEYRSCLIGCSQCSTELDNGDVEDSCFTFCKKYNYSAVGIRKGIIEPDKACLMGCVINTCQEVCIGGTTDQDVTPANQNLWWGLGGTGCSIKTGLGYVQSPEYGNPNSNPSQGGDTTSQQCCTNAFNLCYYVGDKSNNPNWDNVQYVTRKSCLSFVPAQQDTSKQDADICTWYNTASNCGTQGMGP